MTPTAISAIIPSGQRLKRAQEWSGERQLQLLDQHADTAIQMLVYGILWAHQTGRISGTRSMTLRRATPWQVCQLVSRMVVDGLTVPAEVPAWLNANL